MSSYYHKEYIPPGSLLTSGNIATTDRVKLDTTYMGSFERRRCITPSPLISNRYVGSSKTPSDNTRPTHSSILSTTSYSPRSYPTTTKPGSTYIPSKDPSKNTTATNSPNYVRKVTTGSDTTPTHVTLDTGGRRSDHVIGSQSSRANNPKPDRVAATSPIQDYCTRLTYSPAMNILCLTTISEVNPHLYLSGASAVNEYKLRAKGITFVVNVTVDFPNVRAPGVECMAIRLDDSPSSQLLPYFDSVADKIREVAGAPGAPGKTLVHCMVGASRSATLVIAYLMKHRKMTLLQAYHYLKRIRPVVRPNPGFFRQLVTYEYKLFGRNTVKMLYVPVTRTFLPDVYCEEY